jgi:hypothetical protein
VWTKFYQYNLLHSCEEKIREYDQKNDGKDGSAPFLVGKDVTANFFLFALDSLYVSEHAFRLEPSGKLGFNVKVNQSAELN